MNKKHIIIFVLVLNLLNTGNLYAYSNETYNSIVSYDYFVTGNVEYGTDVVQVEVEHTDDNYRFTLRNNEGSIVHQTTILNGAERFFGLSCNGEWEITRHDGAQNVIDTDYITVDEIEETTEPCLLLRGENYEVIEGGGGSDAHLQKLNEILGAIPPPPNWDTVSNTFASKFENMLGSAPDPQPLQQINEPSQPTAPDPTPEPEEPTANIDDQDINEKTPEFQESEGLDESTFTEDDLEQSAEEIEFREDEEGGFEINDPVDSLPDLPSDDLPKPDETDPGEYGEHQPDQEEIEFPDDPQDGEGEPIPETPPTPDETEEEPPQPNEDYTAPTPDDSGGEEPSGSEYYKESPF